MKGKVSAEKDVETKASCGSKPFPRHVLNKIRNVTRSPTEWKINGKKKKDQSKNIH